MLGSFAARTCAMNPDYVPCEAWLRQSTPGLLLATAVVVTVLVLLVIAVNKSGAK